MAESSDVDTEKEPQDTGLRVLSDSELQEILDKHKLWVESEENEGERADLRNVDLSKNRQIVYGVDANSGLPIVRADFSGINLEKAILEDTNLERAILDDANLTEARLNRTCFNDARFINTQLRDAQLVAAHLTGAALASAGLEGANLSAARLDYAGFGETKLYGANLKRAVLTGSTGLLESQLAGTDLRKAKLPEGIGDFQASTNVTEMAKHARNVFVTLMIACAISWLTILQTRDAALLTNSSIAPLPVIQAKVPVVSFFLLAPVLLLVLYYYFHMYLRDYWIGLGSLPAFFPDGLPLNQRAYPWILSTLVLSYVPLLKKQQPAHSVQFVRFSVFAAWWVVPLTVVWFWLRYLPLRTWGVTTVQIVIVALTGAFAIFSYFRAVQALQPKGWPPEAAVPHDVAAYVRRHLAHGRPTQLFVLVCIACFGVSYGAMNLATDYRHDLALSWLFLTLDEAQLSVKGAEYSDWSKRETAGRPPVRGAALERRDLRAASARGAFLVNAELYGCDLSYANLIATDLSGAKLMCANLYGADLLRANLKGVWLQWANLRRADLRRADLKEALLQGADLKGAWLQGADLNNARWLTQEQLDKACGDEHTKLPDGLTIKPCPKNKE